jgi:outer membrane lipoprotein-sorting protein
MKKIIKTMIYSGCLLLAINIAAGRDLFSNIKDEITSAKMIRLQAQIIIKSKIFESIDTTSGIISIGDDGRYCAKLDSDIYLFDGRCIWEVSYENKQATKQCLKDGERFQNRLFFLKDIDGYYNSKMIIKDSTYILTLKDKKGSGLPDTLTVLTGGVHNKISMLKYFDLNGDMNEVNFNKLDCYDIVDSAIFEIQLPDSIEVISIP